MGKIEQNKEQKRRAILDSAEYHFMAEGYVLASMDKIAEQANVTKQTVYRYFTSKTDLFQATLKHMGENSEDSFLDHLQKPDTKTALRDFAVAFTQAHLTNGHLKTYRLLVAESAKAPEIVNSFFSVGPDQTDVSLSVFFSERLGLAEPNNHIRLWTAMLLAFRDDVLLGKARPSDQELRDHAIAATEFLLSGIVEH